MGDIGKAVDSAELPPSVRRRQALVQRLAVRATPRGRLADAVANARSPKLLRAATRIAPMTEGRRAAFDAGPVTRIRLPDAVAAGPASGAASVALEPDQPTGDRGSDSLPAGSPAPASGGEATTFRAMMQERYGMPDAVFESMFGDRDETIVPAADPRAGPGGRAVRAGGADARATARGARILEGPVGATRDA